MNWHMIIGILAGILQISAIIPYAKDILKRETKPNIVSWALWTFIQIIAIIVLLSSAAGASWSLVLLIATTFNTGLVVVLCLMGYGYKEFGTVEKVCLVLAVAAIALWVAVKNPVLTLTFDILADIAAATPTIVKTWKDPHSEIASPWLMVTIAAFLGVLSANVFNLENVGFPIYLVCVNGLITALAYAGQRRSPKPTMGG